MLIPFITLGIGILSVSLGVNVFGATVCIISGTILYLWIVSLKKDPVKLYKASPLHNLWIAVWFLGIGIILGNLSLSTFPTTDQINNCAAATGKILSIKNSTSGDRILTEVYALYDKTGNRTDYSNFKILCFTDAVEHDIGDIILFPANNLREIENSENSFSSGYRETMATKGIFFKAFLKGNEITKIGHETGILTFSSHLRDRVTEFIEKLPLKKNTRYFLITILAGDKSYLDYDTQNLFSDAGIAHTLALSGMHVGIISGIFLFLLFPLNFFGK